MRASVRDGLDSALSVARSSGSVRLCRRAGACTRRCWGWTSGWSWHASWAWRGVCSCWIAAALWIGRAVWIGVVVESEREQATRLAVRARLQESAGAWVVQYVHRTVVKNAHRVASDERKSWRL